MVQVISTFYLFPARQTKDPTQTQKTDFGTSLPF